MDTTKSIIMPNNTQGDVARNTFIVISIVMWRPRWDLNPG